MKHYIALIACLLVPSLALAQDITILTWNVFTLPKPIKFSRQNERTRVIASELPKENPDIIVLQEAFLKKFEYHIEDTLSASHPYVYKLGKGGTRWHAFDSGVMVLSKYPMQILDQLYFKRCSGFDCYASKGAALLEVSINGKPLQIVATHMQSGKSLKKAQVRSAQLNQIKQMMGRHKRTDVSQLLIGDLNIDGLKGEEYHRALRKLSMNSPSLLGELTSSKATNTRCFGKKNTKAKTRVDHIWVNSEDHLRYAMNLKVTPIKGRVNRRVCDLSDHLPLTMNMTL